MMPEIVHRPELAGKPRPATKYLAPLQEWALANGVCTHRTNRGFGYFAEVCGKPVKQQGDPLCPRHAGAAKAAATREKRREEDARRRADTYTRQRQEFATRRDAFARYGITVQHREGAVVVSAADADRLIALLDHKEDR